MEKHDSVSVFIYCQFPTKELKLLLLIHKKFRKWIVPGGHVEKSENQVEAAIREAYEETGIALDYSDLKSINAIIEMPTVKGIRQLIMPAFVFEQEIPEHNNNSAHYHIDHVYFAYFNNNEMFSSLIGPDESQEINWYSEEEIHNLDMFQSNTDVASFLFKHIRKNYY